MKPTMLQKLTKPLAWLMLLAGDVLITLGEAIEGFQKHRQLTNISWKRVWNNT